MQLREVGLYVICVAVGSVIGATWGATSRAVAGNAFWPAFEGWFLGDVLASLVLAPTILLIAQGAIAAFRRSSRPRVIEAGSLLLAILVVGSLVFGNRIEGPTTTAALLYLQVPLLIWAAVRFGPLGLSLALSLVTALAIAGVVNGFGPFVGLDVGASVFQLQLFLLGVGVPLFCLATLVLERRNVRTSLEQSEQRYRAVVSNFPNGIVLLFGSDLQQVIADGQGLPQLGLSVNSVEGKSVWEVFPPEIVAILAPRFREALGGKQASFDLPYADRIYNMHVLPIDQEGDVAGMAIMQDVTDQRGAAALVASEAALRLRNEQLAELNDAKSEFLSVMSHEVRTPLGTIRGFSEMIRDDRLDSSDVLEYASIICSEAQRLGRLLDDLLDLDRLEFGRIDLHLGAVNLKMIVSDVVEQAGPSISGHTFQTSIELSTGSILADRDKLAQILANLISNAIKYSPDGGVISIGAKEEGDDLHLWVTDEGLGIPPESQEAIFERYARVESGRHRGIKGIGLGLPIVRQIAELHGGWAWAESEPGRGSTFHVTLPIQGPQARDASSERIQDRAS